MKDKVGRGKDEKERERGGGRENVSFQCPTGRAVVRVKASR